MFYAAAAAAATINDLTNALPIDPMLSITLNQTVTLMMTLCAICGSADLVIPCLTCERPQCEECFSKEDDLLRTCKGCLLEKALCLDEEDLLAPVPVEEEEEEEEEEEKEQEDMSVGTVPPPPPPALQLHLGYMFHPSHRNAHPREYMERGVHPFSTMSYPTYNEWKHAENILVSHIMFTTSSTGIQRPRVDIMYLVGQLVHRFMNQTTLTTDYMMRFEEDIVNPGHYIWVKYISTYYSRSPLPYNENIFYPYPLPLQFLPQ